MSQKGDFIGLCIAQVARRMFLGRRVSLAYPEGLPVSIDQVNVDPVKLPKKKERAFSSLRAQRQVQKMFQKQLSRSVQLGKIRSRSVSSLHTQFGGDKIRNHILYPTPLIALEMSDKEGVVVDIVFCSPSICVPDPKNPKISFSLHGAARTSRMTWCNLFGHQSTQSAFLS